MIGNYNRGVAKRGELKGERGIRHGCEAEHKKAWKWQESKDEEKEEEKEEGKEVSMGE